MSDWLLMFAKDPWLQPRGAYSIPSVLASSMKTGVRNRMEYELHP